MTPTLFREWCDAKGFATEGYADAAIALALQITGPAELLEAPGQAPTKAVLAKMPPIPKSPAKAMAKPPGVKAPGKAVVKSKVSGMRKDKLGRVRCYNQGVLVKCPAKVDTKKPREKAQDDIPHPAAPKTPPGTPTPRPGAAPPPPGKPSPPPKSPPSMHPDAVKAHAQMSNLIDKSPHLSAEHKAHYKAAMGLAMQRMPPKAIESIKKNLKAAYFGKTANEVVDRLIENASADDAAALRGSKMVACFGQGGSVKGKIFLNGHDDAQSQANLALMGTSKDLLSKGEMKTHQIYAHELTHAIDGGDFVISSSPEWKEAQNAEIGINDSFYQSVEGTPLSKYARTMHSEGLAEFGRLMYSGDHDLAMIEKKFPKCAAVAKKHGIWPSRGGSGKREAKEAGPLLDEVFTHRVELGDGSHADVDKEEDVQSESVRRFREWCTERGESLADYSDGQVAIVLLEATGTCKPGERADLTHCTPATKDAKTKPGKPSKRQRAKQKLSKANDAQDRWGASQRRRQSVINHIVKQAGTAADAVKGVADRIGQSVWDKIPPAAQEKLTQTWAIVKAVEHKVMTGFRKAREMAAEVAKEKGKTPEQAERLAWMLGVADVALGWTVNMPATFAVTGNPLAAKASSWFPVASAGYIAMSFATNPFATIRAARNMVTGEAGAKHEAVDRDFAGDLLDKIADRGDWYEALVYAALDEAGHDIRAAVEIADAAWEEQQDDPSDQEEWDGFSEAVEECCDADYRAPVPVQRQDDDYQCGAASFAAVCRHFGIHAFSPDMAKQLGTTPADGTDAEAMLAMAKRLGLQATGKTGMALGDIDRCLASGNPVIVSLDRWGGSHWAVVVDYDDEAVHLMDPASGYDSLPVDDFLKRWELDAGRYGIAFGEGLTEEKGAADKDSDPEAVADLIADILGGIYGDKAIELFADVEETTEAILFEGWSAIDHPRGKGGRFISKGSAEAGSAAEAKIKDALKKPATPDGLKELTEHLSILSVKQLQAIKKKYGLSASGRTKQQLRDKIADRLNRGRREPAGDDDGNASADRSGKPGSRPTGEPPGETGQDVGKTPSRSDPATADQGRPSGSEPVGAPAPQSVPASPEEVDRRLSRYQNLFAAKAKQHTDQFGHAGHWNDVSNWMEQLRAHVNEVGPEAALAALGPAASKKDGSPIQYEGGWQEMGHFAETYLARHGITPIYGAADPNAPVISSQSPTFGKQARPDPYMVADFAPKDPTFKDKLEEAKHLPGLESSEDINVIMGDKVTHLTPEVVAKMNERYGDGQWIIKAYGNDAFAGHGIYFPQRVQQIQKDAQATLWHSGQELGKYGFSHLRDDAGKVVGIKHAGGDEYRFGTDSYEKTIQGDARHWAEQAAAAAENEKGAALLDREGKASGKDYMAQPAFKAVGVSDADRASGKTIAPGEARVHIVTRNGKAEVVPHSAWIKGESLPVVFESADTKAMAQAAVDAINALPESERQGQIYAPDIIKAEGGYKVVEANPANETGSSGYLGDNPFIIDSYVSHLTGREPGHVAFIRGILSRKRARP